MCMVHGGQWCLSPLLCPVGLGPCTQWVLSTSVAIYRVVQRGAGAGVMLRGQGWLPCLHLRGGGAEAGHPQLPLSASRARLGGLKALGERNGLFSGKFLNVRILMLLLQVRTGGCLANQLTLSGMNVPKLGKAQHQALSFSPPAECLLS